MSYPMGWSIITRLNVKRERWPGGSMVSGIPLVYPGQEVVPDQPVLRLRSLEAPAEHGLPDSFKSIYPTSSALQASSTLTPQQPSRLDSEDVPAGLHGRVVGFTSRGGVVIESRAALVQGMFGAGHQVAGVVTFWEPEDFERKLTTIPPGAILIVPGQLTFTLLHQALASGIIGIVAGSILLRDLEGFLRTDYLQLLRADDVALAQSALPPLTILITEGMGSHIMPAQTQQLLRTYQGSIALLTGVTSLRFGLYSELIISLPLAETEHHWRPVQPDPTLALGTQVRIISGQLEGTIGMIDYFFVHEQVYQSGIRARSARLRTQDGSTYVMPVVMLERIW